MMYFSYRNFDLQKLIRIKQQQKIRIGLVLPIKDEEKTLPKIIKQVKKCSNLIDQCIAIDSGSTDRSLEICRKEKIPVFSDIKIARKLKKKLRRGKGWNLWSSTFLLNTDIIVWIDSDVINFSPRFVIGIVGPLLVNKNLQFVKGYYRRPKNDARVTELMARPLVSLLFPELEVFVQPLSGEYGGRRRFLRDLNFYSGYSVEIAILIQSMVRLKPNQIAQSYLGSRTHKQQTLDSLSIMSTSILRTTLLLAAEYKRIKINCKIKDYLYKFTLQHGGRKLKKEKHFIADTKLRPIKD